MGHGRAELLKALDGAGERVVKQAPNGRPTAGRPRRRGTSSEPMASGKTRIRPGSGT